MRPGQRAAEPPLKRKGEAAGLGPVATGISRFIWSAWSGATCLRSSGGGAGGAVVCGAGPEACCTDPATAAAPITASTPTPSASRGWARHRPAARAFMAIARALSPGSGEESASV